MTSLSSIYRLNESRLQFHNACSSVESSKFNGEDHDSLNFDGLNVVEGYKRCKKLVIEAGFKAEIEWQSTVSIEDLTESTFLREHAWVTLSAGMKEKVIRNLFQRFSRIFYNWKSADLITKNEELCKDSALTIFANYTKINAILQTSHIVSYNGFDIIKKLIIENPEKVLMEFPYIGPVTYYHLAKNIGVQVAKPDRHLSRLVNELNFSNVQTLCRYIGERTGDSIPVVDIVLWRYATITEDFVMRFIQLSKKI